jgi:hypothetical protein
MKTRILLIAVFVFNSLVYASDTLKVDSLKPRFIAASLQRMSEMSTESCLNTMMMKKALNLKIKRIRMGFNFLGIFLPPLLFFGLPSIGDWSLNDDYIIIPWEKMNKINGLQLSLINMEPTVMNGLEINVSSNISTYAVINGVSVSPFFNLHHEMKGVSVAPFANVGMKCRGIQIGLYNRCNDFRGIQIGMWNENGKENFH